MHFRIYDFFFDLWFAKGRERAGGLVFLDANILYIATNLNSQGVHYLN